MRQKFKQWTHDLNQESLLCFALIQPLHYNKPINTCISYTINTHAYSCILGAAKRTISTLTRYCWFGSSAWSRWINLPMSTCSSAKSSGSSGSAGWSLWSCTRTFTMFKMLSTFNDMCTGIIQEIQNKKMNWLCQVITFNAYMHASVKLIQCFFFWLFTHTDVCIVAYVLKI